MAHTLSTVVDILADHVVWYGSKCGAVANAPVQKFDVRGAMTPFERGAAAIPFADDAIPNIVPVAAAPPLQTECSYLHDTKANAR